MHNSLLPHCSDSDTLLQRLILKPAKLEQLASGIRAIAKQEVSALHVSWPSTCFAAHVPIGFTKGEMLIPLVLPRFLLSEKGA
eukprot:1158446-Pelagomonas_calceolata.AAC.12